MAALASAEPCPSSGGILHCTNFSLEMVQRNGYCALQQSRRKQKMADETQVEAEAAAEAPAKVAEAVADTVEKIVKESATVAKRERAKTVRRAKVQAVAAKIVQNTA